MRVGPVTTSMSSVERKIARHASGLGCIRCACSIYRYVSLAPDGERTPHPGVDDVFLLCPGCLAAVNGMGNAAMVVRALRSNPVTKQAEWNRERLPYPHKHELPEVRIAPATVMRRTPYPIAISGVPVLSLDPAEEVGGPLQMSLSLGTGADGPTQLVLCNEWRAPPGWQFGHRGHRYSFSSSNGLARIVLGFYRGDVMAIEALATRVGDMLLEVDADGARLNGDPVDLPDANAQLIGVSL